MIKEGQEVFIKTGDIHIQKGIVEEIGKEGNKKYYGISGFADWKNSKEVFETEAKAKKACGVE
ncbi:hypothetical protein K413DRAFT_4637 [Clostridium sp. ASBs410]|nr:hypothetical protein K413DRAFT_4637 [Clostridium sp. ASBs410]